MAVYVVTTAPQVVADAERRSRLANAGPSDVHLTWASGAGAEVLHAGAMLDLTPTSAVSAETPSGTATLTVTWGAGVDAGATSQRIRGGTA